MSPFTDVSYFVFGTCCFVFDLWLKSWVLSECHWCTLVSAVDLLHHSNPALPLFVGIRSDVLHFACWFPLHFLYIKLHGRLTFNFTVSALAKSFSWRSIIALSTSLSFQAMGTCRLPLFVRRPSSHPSNAALSNSIKTFIFFLEEFPTALHWRYFFLLRCFTQSLSLQLHIHSCYVCTCATALIKTDINALIVIIQTSFPRSVNLSRLHRSMAH